jgi:hypothetical protein
MTLQSKRGLSLLGALLLADGSVFLLDPSGQIRLWSSSRAPSWYRRAMSYFARHTGLCRALSVAEIAAGMALVARSSRRG